MGKQGIIQHSTGRPEGGPPNFYVVEFHGATFRDNVFAISPDWLEEAVE